MPEPLAHTQRGFRSGDFGYHVKRCASGSVLDLAAAAQLLLVRQPQAPHACGCDCGQSTDWGSIPLCPAGPYALWGALPHARQCVQYAVTNLRMYCMIFAYEELATKNISRGSSDRYRFRAAPPGMATLSAAPVACSAKPGALDLNVLMTWYIGRAKGQRLKTPEPSL
jgi:hypothetical protein